MRILHYTLGFAPYRSGGLTKYVTDLMIAQQKLGHDVYCLYPGGYSFVRQHGYVHLDKSSFGLGIYEITNPMPVPLFYGTNEPDKLMDESNLDKKSFIRMLEEVKPDVLHVHTLMGIPRAYLQIVHDKKIKIVYTSHDYFGLCLKVNLIDVNGKFCEKICVKNCEQCNRLGKNILFLRLRNAKWMVPFKPFIRKYL